MPRHPLRWLLCASALAACSGNSLEDFSGRELRVQVLPGSRESGRFPLQAELVPHVPEAGCLRLHEGVQATLDGAPLWVFRGTEAPAADGPCGSPRPVPPTFNASLDVALFDGAPRNAVLEIRDGEERIVAEFQNFYGRHALARTEPALEVKRGQEVWLAWEPPTDDLAIIKHISVFPQGATQALEVPARPEAGGLRVTFPADFPPGRVRAVARAPSIPAVRCEGVALCSALASPGNVPSAEYVILP